MLTYALEKNGSRSLYTQLYGCIRRDILSGALPPRQKLPSKRALAQHLEVSVITVKNAYEQLAAEGYIYTVEKKGYYVSPVERPLPPADPPPLTPEKPAEPVFLDVSGTDFQITEEALSACLTERTRAIVLNSPCNPTGVILHKKSLDTVARAVLGKNIYLICDNVYNQLVYAPCGDLTRREELRPQTILCQSFSKPYAMTGWRVGYLVCPEELLSRLLLLSAAEIAAVPTFIQAAAETALTVDTEPMRQIYEKRRNYVCRCLDAMGLAYPKPEGAFYVFADISRFGIPSWTFCERMIREAGLAAVPGTCFGTEGYIRLSYCYSDRELEESLDRLEGFLKRLG